MAAIAVITLQNQCKIICDQVTAHPGSQAVGAVIKLQYQKVNRPSTEHQWLWFGSCAVAQPVSPNTCLAAGDSEMITFPVLVNQTNYPCSTKSLK
jgi:hypothetical protein